MTYPSGSTSSAAGSGSTAFGGTSDTSASTGSTASTGATAFGGTGSAGSTDTRSLGEILSDVTTDLSTLMRQEVALAKAEATQSAKKAGTGVGMFAGAGVGAHFVLLFLSIALWWAIGDKTGRGWAALIVALVWAIIAAVLALRGRAEMKKIKGLPQTGETVKEIPGAVKPNAEAGAAHSQAAPSHAAYNTNAYNVNEEQV